MMKRCNTSVFKGAGAKKALFFRGLLILSMQSGHTAARAPEFVLAGGADSPAPTLYPCGVQT
jgi:hypothetical protein